MAYKPGQAGVAGEGTVRAHIKTTGVGVAEAISQIDILDGGKNFQANEVLVIPAGNGNISGDELTISAVQTQNVNLTEAIVNNTFGNATWGAGESGFYDFDVNGAPAVGGARLAYNEFEPKLEQVVTKTMVLTQKSIQTQKQVREQMTLSRRRTQQEFNR